MLKIKTKTGPSSIHGIGLFADEFIPAGTITWEFHPNFDISFEARILDELTDSVREKFLWYSYWDPRQERFILCSDDLRFINHSSKNPNIKSTPDCDTAIRDISPGEELLCNYRDYEPDWFERRGYSQEEFDSNS